MNTKTQKTIVGLKELRENMEVYIDRINKGESITVFRRSTPLFRLSPVNADEVVWETVVDFTKIVKSGVDAKKVLAVLKKMHG